MDELEKHAARWAARMKAVADEYGGDPEAAHGRADDMLCDLLIELGYRAVVDEWDKIDKWYA